MESGGFGTQLFLVLNKKKGFYSGTKGSASAGILYTTFSETVESTLSVHTSTVNGCQQGFTGTLQPVLQLPLQESPSALDQLKTIVVPFSPTKTWKNESGLKMLPF